VSTLNFASRNPENTGIRNALKRMARVPIERSSGLKSISIPPKTPIFRYEKAMAPGANPKLMISANESSSLPMGEYAFSIRAANPSQKSNMAEQPISIEAVIKYPSKAIRVAILPENRFKQVIVLGICGIIPFLFAIRCTVLI